MQIAPDLRLLFNKRKHLWGIYQVRSNHILLIDSQNPDKPWLLWDVTTESGEFRLPDRRDIVRAARSVASGREAFKKGGDWYADKLEAMEQANLDAARTRTDNKVRALASEVKFHTTVAINRSLRGANRA